jgi:hypothetical protein
VPVRTLVAIATVALACMLPGVATAHGPAGDSVTGEARDCEPAEAPGECVREHGLTIDAQRGARRQPPTGSLEFFTASSISAAGFSILRADATCLSVKRQVAIVGFTGQNSVPFYGIMQPLIGFVRIVDGGAAGTGADSFEVVVVGFGNLGEPLLPGPTDCSTFPAAPERFVNDSGDLAVTDARRRHKKDKCNRPGSRYHRRCDRGLRHVQRRRPQGPAAAASA